MDCAVYFLVFLQTLSVFGGSEHYYWRDYTGIIPPDAVPGGRDLNGDVTYIGEGYIHLHGLCVATIFRGQREVDFECFGVKTISVDVKILCSDTPEYFSWLRTTKQSIKEDTRDLNVVKAGYDKRENRGVMTIMKVGRTSFQGHVVIGNIPNDKLWFPFKKRQYFVNSYEVLTVEVPGIIPRIGK